MNVERAEKHCRRCNQNEPRLKVRSEAICRSCYLRFVNQKVIKRLEKLAGEINVASTHTKRILVGLSLGACSTALVDILHERIIFQQQKRPNPTFEVVVVFVEGANAASDLSPETVKEVLDRFSARYPYFAFRRVPLANALSLNLIDWAALPSKRADGDAKAELQEFLGRLPSTTSRADVTRLFLRHVLIDSALRENCLAVVLGCSTTALAELTLAEVTKGRGFGVPSMLGDGMVHVPRFQSHEVVQEEDGSVTDRAQRLAVYYPNREVYRGELVTYVSLVEPPLTDLVKSDSSYTAAAAIVSHRNVSIDDVMARYFVEVEENCPSIVANVVRTTGKLMLSLVVEGAKSCGLCGIELHELADERWKGEIVDDGGGDDGRLCYGCSRAMRM